MGKKKAVKRGRPKGSRNRNVDVVEVIESRCEKCGSGERENYINKRTLPLSGRTMDGRLYTSVTWRRTRCLKCGQWRDDKTYDDRG